MNTGETKLSCSCCGTTITNKRKSGLCRKCYNARYQKEKLSLILAKRRADYLNSDKRAKIRKTMVARRTKNKERCREYEIQYRYGISKERYKQITAKCVICGFDKTVDIHHLNKNWADSSDGNLIGLCPNCHMLLHRKNYTLTQLKQEFGGEKNAK